jgi:hypothetical protein
MSIAARILLFVYIACLGYTVRYHVAATDLDGAWAVALNYAQVHGFIHGRDIAFTYGPLSYLVLPMAMGSNLGLGISFQLFFWAAFIAFAAWVAFSRQVPLVNLLIFAICLYPGSRLFWTFGYAGPDFFLSFLVLLLIAATAANARWYIFWIPAILLSALLLLVKLSSGIAAISAVLVFPAAMFLIDRRKSTMLLTSAILGVPAFFIAGYLSYHPSFASLWGYLKAGFETSAGHSTAMSLPGDPAALTTALILLFTFPLLAAALYIAKQPAFAVAVACFGPLFLEFKHSFIRESGHVEILFSFVPLALLAILLFVDFGRGRKWLVPIAAGLIAGVWLTREASKYQWQEMPTAPVQKLQAFTQLFNYSALHSALEQISAQNLQSKRLPATLLSRVSNRTITVIPSQCSYGAANPIRYVPLRTLQGDQAYTPYLDHWTAEMFEGANAPDFALFEWDAIDGRHPLLDTPQTALALYRNYEWDSTYDSVILLRRRSAPLDSKLRLLQTSDVRPGEPMRFPASAHPVIAKVLLEFNMLGRLRDFLFRIPEVRGILASEGTRFITARVPPLVLPGGVPANLLPVDLAEFQSLYRDGTMNEPMTSLVVSGEGASAFSSPVRVEIYEAPGISLTFHPPVLPDFSKLTPRGILDDSRIETMNNTGVIGVSEREIVEVKAPAGYIEVRGWAVNGGAVYVQLDGKIYPSNHGRPRQDIFILYRTPEAAKSGFDWAFPSWMLGNTVHELSLKMLSPDGSGYQDNARKLRFRIVQ